MERRTVPRPFAETTNLAPTVARAVEAPFGGGLELTTVTRTGALSTHPEGSWADQLT